MVGISDYGTVRLPNRTIELRVHGVSGTPPESLLKGPSILVSGSATAGFHRITPTADVMTPSSPGVREAYAWGGLTAGTRITSALRLLLLPFSFVNVAGWMLPGETEPNDGAPTRPADAGAVAGRAAAHALVSRLLAACLTAYVILGATWLATVAIEQVNIKYTIPLLRDTGSQARVTMLAMLLLVALWVVITRRRAAPATTPQGAMARAPVTAASHPGVDVSNLWDGSPVTKRLSGIHATIAIACAALLTSAALGDGPAPADVGRWLAWFALALAALGLVALMASDSWGRWPMRVSKVGGVPAALVAAALVATPRAVPLETVAAQFAMLKRLSHSLTLGMTGLAVAVFVLVGLQVFVGPRGGPLSGRLFSSAFTVIGFGSAITAISGLAVITTWLLTGRNPAVFLAGLAQTIAIIGLVSCSAFVIIVLLRFNATAEPLGVEWWRRLRDTTAHARGAIIAGACVFAVGANVVAAMYLARRDVIDPAGLAPGERGWASAGWLVIAAVVAAIPAARLRTWPARIAGTVVGALLATVLAWYGAAIVAAWVTHTSVQAHASRFLALSDQWFVVAAVVATLVAPMAAVIAYMWRGSKDQSTRRLVGVIWDLVNFWPRQFHPWAPAPYTDTTIPELADRVARLARESGADTIIVSAHSQGAIIAVPALSRLYASGGAGPARISLLTYGQLLDVHYRWLFPWVFNPTLFEEVDAALDHRWVNLYRVTDPLGHPVHAIGAVDAARDREIAEDLLLDMGPTLRAKTLNHGDYWYSRAMYEQATTDLCPREP